MGIAGSLVNHDFFERYLGMRVETVESVEFVCRIEQKIYDKAEYLSFPKTPSGNDTRQNSDA
jgi:L-fucose isomerase